MTGEYIQPDKTPIAKIVYFYDGNIKLYTFLLKDTESNTIDTDYASKQCLLTVKDYLYKQYNIKPIKEDRTE